MNRRLTFEIRELDGKYVKDNSKHDFGTVRQNLLWVCFVKYNIIRTYTIIQTTEQIIFFLVLNFKSPGLLLESVIETN